MYKKYYYGCRIKSIKSKAKREKCMAGFRENLEKLSQNRQLTERIIEFIEEAEDDKDCRVRNMARMVVITAKEFCAKKITSSALRRDLLLTREYANIYRKEAPPDAQLRMIDLKNKIVEFMIEKLYVEIELEIIERKLY